jgi:hypothetical protein
MKSENNVAINNIPNKSTICLPSKFVIPKNATIRSNNNPAKKNDKNLEKKILI